MRVMPANCCNREVHWMGYSHPEKVGHIFSPPGWRPPKPHLYRVGDNDRFNRVRDWSEVDFLRMLDRQATCEARAYCAAERDLLSFHWQLVPDVPYSRQGTIEEWYRWEERLRPYGWPLAFAVQDGMEPGDVPDGAAVVFVGGTTHWKRLTVRLWCEAFPRVHVGRITTGRWLWFCKLAGAESTDGNRMFTIDSGQRAQLLDFWWRDVNGMPPPDHLLGWLGKMFSVNVGWPSIRSHVCRTRLSSSPGGSIQHCLSL